LGYTGSRRYHSRKGRKKRFIYHRLPQTATDEENIFVPPIPRGAGRNKRCHRFRISLLLKNTGSKKSSSRSRNIDEFTSIAKHNETVDTLQHYCAKKEKITRPGVTGFLRPTRPKKKSVVILAICGKKFLS
jgi:hypothetical protein